MIIVYFCRLTNENFNRMTFLLHFWKSAVIALIILVASCINIGSSDIPPHFEIPFADKIVHFMMYFVLTAVVSLDILRFRKTKYKLLRLLALATIIAVFFGGAMELVQHFLTVSRQGDILDFAANATGASMATFAYYFIIVSFKRKKQERQVYHELDARH